MATNPTPKKLALEEAIRSTLKPIEREGDLVCVQKDSRFGNLYMDTTDLAGNEFAAGEMRSIFMPSTDRSVRHFAQLVTKNFLEQLYRNGGYLESLEHFMNEALAMHYGYMAGIVTENGLAGNVGDPSQFEADVRKALSRRLEVKPDELRMIQRDTLEMHKTYKLDANKGRKFPEGRRTGAKAETTIYIENLNSRYPEVTAKELYEIALGEADSKDSPFSAEDEELWDKKKEKLFPLKAFENRLSEIRNPKPKNPGTR